MEQNQITKTYHKLMATINHPRATAILLWIISASYAEMYIKNGWRKFDAEGFWSHSFLEKWGYPLWFTYFIGIVEAIAGVMLLHSKFRPFGSLTLAIVMIGAVLTRTIHGSIHGFSGAEEGLLEIINRLDLMFFVSTIAFLLYLSSLGRATEVKE